MRVGYSPISLDYVLAAVFCGGRFSGPLDCVVVYQFACLPGLSTYLSDGLSYGAGPLFGFGVSSIV